MELSTTDSENVYVPASVGVPASAPTDDGGTWLDCWIKRPGGNAVLARENESGRVPPAALMDALYGTPTMPLGRAVVVMTSVLTAMVKVCVAVFVGVEESVTVTVNVKFPAPDGVPRSMPPLKAKPGGNVPFVTVAL